MWGCPGGPAKSKKLSRRLSRIASLQGLFFCQAFSKGPMLGLCVYGLGRKIKEWVKCREVRHIIAVFMFIDRGLC